MKKIVSIQDTLVNRISFYHLAVFVVSLPFDRLYSELALASFCIHTCIHLDRKKLSAVNWGLIAFLSVVYILTIVGTLFTNVKGEAFYEWERQLALVLFPLALSCSGLDLRKHLLSLLLVMAAGCGATIIYLYLSAFFTISQLGLPVSAVFSYAFINHRFAAPIDMHATYFSMYIALSAAAVGYVIVTTGKTSRRFLYGLLLLVLVIGLIQLSSRSVLIASAVVVNLVFPFMAVDRGRRLRFCIAAFILTAGIVGMITQTGALQSRFTTDLKDDLTKSSLQEPRIRRWELAWELIKTSPVYGHGSGSEVALLKEKYFENRLYNSFLNDLNVHNQYLSILIKTGFVGLVIFLVVLLYGFRMALREKDSIFCSFLLIVCFVFFSENVLDANKGIFFFSFFFTAFCLTAGKRLFENKIVAIGAG